MSEQISNPAPVAPAVFQFENHGIRTIEIDGEVWFVAKDIAEAIGVTWKGAGSVSHVPEEWKRGVLPDGTPLTLINEAGAFFFLNRSDKPAALPLQKKVAGEILPSIRKHGHYSVAPVPALPTDTRDLLFLAVDAIRTVTTEIKQLESRTAQAEDMALAAATGLDELKQTTRLHQWQMCELRKMVNDKVKALAATSGLSTGKLFGMVWGFIKHHFRVTSYHGIPAVRYEESKLIVTNLTLQQMGGQP